MIGKKISPILEEIEIALLEFEANKNVKPEFTIEGFRAAIKIFMAVFIDKIFELQLKEGISLKDSLLMVEKAGEDFRRLIKTYTDVDTHKFYK